MKTGCKLKLYQKITYQLLELIKSGELKAGDRLPPERQLAEMMKVSRTAIREALRSMESFGYITSKTGGGTYIKAITLENVISPFSVMLSQDKKLIRELVDVRVLLETEIAALAAKKITPEEEKALYATIEQMQNEIDSGLNGLDADNAFHTMLANIADNSAMRLIYELCAELLSKTRETTLNVPGQPVKSLAEHKKICSSICAGDDRAASRYMWDHLKKAQKLFDKMLFR